MKHITNFFVEEQFLTSKTGKLEDCEDSIYIGNYFIAVIDGATSKGIRKWNNKTSGQVSAHILNQVFDLIACDATALQATNLMTSAIQDFYKQQGIVDIMAADPLLRVSASVVVVSLWRQEIWLIGDCQALLGNERISNDMLIDQICSEARAFFIKSETLKGVSMEELYQHDTGRDFIMPLLERQALFQNNPSAGEYRYPIVDGFPIPNDGIIIRDIPDNTEAIILATDGYPILKENLKESEAALREILTDDPLLFYKHKSTKGLRQNHISFDDRAFVKVTLSP